jgi:hypothetical protein
MRALGDRKLSAKLVIEHKRHLEKGGQAMTMLDEEGCRFRCDRCECEYLYNEEKSDIDWFWGYVVFYNRHKPKFPDLCQRCSKEVTPLVHSLREIVELKMAANKLERAINEK